MRRRKRLRFFDLEKIEQGREPLSPTELEVREGLAYDLKEQLVSKLDLEAALHTLTPRQKAAFLLFADGHTEAEIAQALGVSPQAAHQLISKAKAALRKILQGGW